MKLLSILFCCSEIQKSETKNEIMEPNKEKINGQRHTDRWRERKDFGGRIYVCGCVCVCVCFGQDWNVPF